MNSKMIIIGLLAIGLAGCVTGLAGEERVPHGGTDSSDSESDPLTDDSDTNVEVDSNTESDDIDSETETEAPEPTDTEDTETPPEIDESGCIDLGDGNSLVSVPSNGCAKISPPAHLNGQNMTVAMEGTCIECPFTVNWVDCNNEGGADSFTTQYSPNITVGPVDSGCDVLVQFNGTGSQELDLKFW